MTRALITGDNKGPGFETARRLVAAGHTVGGGARDPERGRAAADALGARFVRIDVTDDASVAAAAHDAQHVEGRAVAPLYTASKAAVTMPTTQYAKSWPGVKANAADPGCTATDRGVPGTDDDAGSPSASSASRRFRGSLPGV